MKSITYICEFADKDLEREFLNNEMSRIVKYTRPISLMLGILYFLFIIPDYFLIKNIVTFTGILVNRGIFAVLVLLMYLWIMRIRNYYYLVYWITIYEVLATVLFLHVYYQYESPDFLIQAYGVMIIILAVFLVPNRWINMVGVSALLCLGFLVVSAYKFDNIEFFQYSAGLVYTVIIIVLSSISSYQAGYYKRIQYMNSKELICIAMTDPLTGIYNRLHFDKELEKWVEYSKKNNRNLSLAMFDFDNFKSINDRYGHLMGDKVLINSIKLVKGYLKESDILARWGGEEFVVLFTDTTFPDAMQTTERIRVAIQNYKFKKIGQVTCSFGVTSLSENDNSKSLLKTVDQFLYQAKGAGRNTVIGKEDEKESV